MADTFPQGMGNVQGEPQAVYNVRRPDKWDEEWAWSTTKTLQEIQSKLNLILSRLDTRASGNTPITPELEREVKRAGVSAVRMDRKTPDTKKSPPKRKQTKRKKR